MTSFLGETQTSNPELFRTQWQSRFRAAGEEGSVKMLAQLLTAYAAGLRRMADAGSAVFDSANAENVLSVTSQAGGAILAIADVFPDQSGLAKRYPAYWDQVKAAQESMYASLDIMGATTTSTNPPWNPAIGDMQMQFYRQRDTAIRSADLDNPIVHRDLKNEIIKKAYEDPTSLLPGLATAITARFQKSGETVPQAPPPADVIAPAEREKYGIVAPEATKTEEDNGKKFMTVAALALAAYFMFK